MIPIEQISWARQIIGAAAPEDPRDTIKRLASENVRLNESLKTVTKSRDESSAQVAEIFRIKEHWRRTYEDTQSALNTAGRVNLDASTTIGKLTREVKRLKHRVNELIRRGKASK